MPLAPTILPFSCRIPRALPNVCLWISSCTGVKGGTELVGVTNQWLDQLETHAMRGGPCLTLSGGLRTRIWIETNTTSKNNRKSMKWVLMILCYPRRLEPRITVIGEVSSCTDGTGADAETYDHSSNRFNEGHFLSEQFLLETCSPGVFTEIMFPLFSQPSMYF